MTVRTSTAFENALLSTLRGTSYSVAVVYASLHTGDPGQTGANEVTGGTYARVAISFSAPSAGSMPSSAAVTWNVPASTTVSYVGLWDAVTGGNYLVGGPLGSSAVFGSLAGTFTILAGNFTALDNTL